MYVSNKNPKLPYYSKFTYLTVKISQQYISTYYLKNTSSKTHPTTLRTNRESAGMTSGGGYLSTLESRRCRSLTSTPPRSWRHRPGSAIAALAHTVAAGCISVQQPADTLFACDVNNSSSCCTTTPPSGSRQSVDLSNFFINCWTLIWAIIN